jgi:two-component system LytT family response regulator
MTMRVIIADDEPLARKRLSRLLASEDVEIVAQCADGNETVAAVRRLRPELLLLDVSMPELDGLGALEELGADRPEVIFVTAWSQHAVRAFEENAVDYVLKPFQPARLKEAIARARLRKGTNGLAQVLRVLQPAYAERLPVRNRGKIGFVRVADIDYIEADGNYLRIVCGKETKALRETLSSLEARLDPKKFARIHRSTIVNVDRIRELEPWSGGDYGVALHDGRVLTMSRTCRGALSHLLGK